MNYSGIPLKDRPEPNYDKKMVASVLLQMARALIGNFEYFPKMAFNENFDFFFWDFSLDEEGKYFTALSKIIDRISKKSISIKRLSVLDYTRETGMTNEIENSYFIRRFENSYQKNIFILNKKGLSKASIF